MLGDISNFADVRCGFMAFDVGRFLAMAGPTGGPKKCVPSPPAD